MLWEMFEVEIFIGVMIKSGFYNNMGAAIYEL